MTTLKDPAALIISGIKPLKPEASEKDKMDNEKIKADNDKIKSDAQKERIKAWDRPKTKKERDDARTARRADWEASR